MVSAPQRVEVLSESTSEGSGEPKVIFRAKLQTANEKNQNGRVYSQRVCESITNQLKEKALNRSLLMEVDEMVIHLKLIDLSLISKLILFFNISFF